MITVKDNICHGRESTKLTFEIDIKRDFFESSYDDAIIRDAIFAQIARHLFRDMNEMYFKHTWES